MEVQTISKSVVEAHLRREVQHNPNGIQSVLSNRRNSLGNTSGDGELLRTEIEILKKMEKKENSKTSVTPSKPRF